MELPIMNSSNLPRQLKRMIYESLATTAETEVPMLKGLDVDGFVIGRIFMTLVPTHFLDGEQIYRSREVGGEMFFLTAGSVILSGGLGGKTLNKSSPGDAGLFRDTIYRPHELAKTRKAEQNGPDPYFGHTSLFHEVCKLRPEDAKAYSNVQTLSLTREALETVRGFCPDFYKRLFDFCLLSAARYGLSNETMLSYKNMSGATPKIDQMCLDLRKELFGRHQRILVQQKQNPARKLWKKAISHASGNPGPDPVELSHASGSNPLDQSFDCDVLVCSEGKFMQALPSQDKISADMWRKAFLTTVSDLRVFYVIDDVSRLIESRPRCMGTLEMNNDDVTSTCQVWRQALNIDKSSGASMYGCAFWVRLNDDSDAVQRIFIRRQSQKEAFDFQIGLMAVMTEERKKRNVRSTVAKAQAEKIQKDANSNAIEKRDNERLLEVSLLLSKTVSFSVAVAISVLSECLFDVLLC